MKVRSLALFVSLGFVAGCSTASTDARFDASPPDRATFPMVADVLVHRCGSLDCHGTAYRNFRLYGHEGLRLAPSDRPTSNPKATTVAEVDEDFLSATSLEPELTSAVVREVGAAPERLTLLRKARGAEHHKGGTIVTAGDPADRCITSWLASRTDEAACTQGLINFAPGP